MLKDHFGGIRSAGFGVANAEVALISNTDDSEGLEVRNCDAMGVLRVGAGLDVRKREKDEEAEESQPRAVTVMSMLESFPSSAIGFP